MPRQGRDLIGWLGALSALLLAATVVTLHDRPGRAALALVEGYRWRPGPVAAVAVLAAALVIGATHRGLADRLPWTALLAAGWAATVGWAVGLALSGDGRGLALHATRDVAVVHDDPLGFLARYTWLVPQLGAADRGRPPGGLLVLWGLTRLGLRGWHLGLLLTCLAALSVPLVAIAVRSLCHEPAARRLLPVLVLAPFTGWLAGSVDGLTALLCAGSLACGVVGSEPRRTAWWALGAGLLLGIAGLFSYSAGWLGASLVVTYFVRRRPALNVLSGAGLLLPLELAGRLGFVWPDGLVAARAQAGPTGGSRGWPLWVLLDAVFVLLALGPAALPALRKIRRTPGWPFLVGSLLAVGFALGSGVFRLPADRSLLPFLPWLLVPAVAAEPGAPPTGVAATPILLIAVGALCTLLLAVGVPGRW